MPPSPICRFAWLWVLLPVLTASDAGGQGAGGYADYVDWAGWARVDTEQRAGVASSWDRSGGNYDANHYEYPPGFIWGDCDVTAATLVGPGIIYRFWMPHRTASEPFAYQFYFDDETVPRIDADSDQILDGTFSYFAAPLLSTFAGGQVCYEPIPFRDSLRIETENRAELLHYYQYSVRTFPPGTDIDSWNGGLDAEAQSARLTTIAMFQRAGEHPAGESSSAVRTVIGPTSVPANGTLTIADLNGPGRVRRLTLRMDAAADVELESLRLRAFWDEGSTPSIDAPVGWFFGVGYGRAPYRSLPMGTDSPDGFYCYWPMPFYQSARIELLNPTSDPIPIDSTVVEHDPGPIDANMGYLHAVARDTIRPPGGMHHIMAEIEGTGHYVGNLLFVEQDFDSHRMLEGDDIVIVDEADTLHGTGLEDAYNGGYYYNWVANPMEEPEGGSPPCAIRPLNGILCVRKQADPPFARADQYRWLIGDRIPFTRSLDVRIETIYSSIGSRWKSVVFWYQLPVDVSGAEGPDDAGAQSSRLDLQAATCNAAANALLIRFALPADGPILLDLLDIAGRRVATLSDGLHAAGLHTIRWNCGTLSSGVYFVRLQAGAQAVSRKFVLVR